MNFAFGDFLTGIGFVLVIEGCLLVLAPALAKRMVAEIITAPAQVLRLGGIVSVAIGVALVWVIRG
jgi:uncharacterized protein YjeT (DUF2065 family)